MDQKMHIKTINFSLLSSLTCTTFEQIFFDVPNIRAVGMLHNNPYNNVLYNNVCQRVEASVSNKDMLHPFWNVAGMQGYFHVGANEMFSRREKLKLVSILLTRESFFRNKT